MTPFIVTVTKNDPQCPGQTSVIVRRKSDKSIFDVFIFTENRGTTSRQVKKHLKQLWSCDRCQNLLKGDLK